MRRLICVSGLLAGCIPSFESVGSGDTDATWTKPENEWATCSDGPPAGLVGEGYEVGQVLPDIRLTDQKGTTTSLWQFAGCTTVVDLSTIWCAPCQDIAPDLVELHHEYKPQGVEAITILAEDVEGDPPDGEDLNLWADMFEIEGPVLGDPDKIFSDPMLQGAAYPVILVVGPDLVIRKRVGPDVAQIEAAVQETLAE
jgi:thiol-disulfide isomerase/thioredoxin